ncbi:MAG: DUF2147 domain-containing protein [Prevotella sp.]|nr:DUF2147 domain-containing protein [Prevotella sp.]
MKKLLLTLALIVVSAVGYAQDVIGKWYTEGGESLVEIYKSGDKLNGRIVWLKAGDDKLDSKNPDEKLRSRKLVGTNILTGFTKGKDKWENGRIYNPKDGKTYKSTMWLEGKELKVRGHVAIFHKTQTWTRK